MPCQDSCPTTSPRPVHVSHSCLQDIDSQDGTILHALHPPFPASRVLHSGSPYNLYVPDSTPTVLHRLLLQYCNLHCRVRPVPFPSMPTGCRAHSSRLRQRNDKLSRTCLPQYSYSPAESNNVDHCSGKSQAVR